MDPFIFKLIFLASPVLQVIIRFPFNRQRRGNTIETDLFGFRELIAVFILSAGIFILPLIYIFSDWLRIADYRLPLQASWTGVGILFCSLFVFWRSHADLGRNWSPSLQLREKHTLITQGIYRYIRHPMYTSVLILVIAQVLLLPNWIVSITAVLSMFTSFLMRVPREERMMRIKFGNEYEVYSHQTGRFFPRPVRKKQKAPSSSPIR